MTTFNAMANDPAMAKKIKTTTHTVLSSVTADLPLRGALLALANAHMCLMAEAQRAMSPKDFAGFKKDEATMRAALEEMADTVGRIPDDDDVAMLALGLKMGGTRGQA